LCPLDRLLHSDLAKLTEDYRRACSDRESSRQEVENLKLQLQGYVSEVKRAEELLTMKVCKMCGSTFVLPPLPPKSISLVHGIQIKSSCAAVSVTSLYVWMFAFNYHSLCKFPFL